MTSTGDTEWPNHPGGEWTKLRLTALEQDVLYHHLMDTIEKTDPTYQLVLDDILDKLPEEDIVSRDLSMETLIEIGYLDGPLGTFNAGIVVGDSDE